MPRNMIIRALRAGICAAMLVVALLVPSSALARDRDHDRMPDRWEKKHGLSIHKANARGDKDRDHLSNLGEFRAGTDPEDADSDDDCIADDDEDGDHDGVDNGQEMREHTNPGVRDTDDDGVGDGAEDADDDGVANRDEDDGDVEVNDDQDDDNQCGDGAEDDGEHETGDDD
jgi:hypothetical protein